MVKILGLLDLFVAFLLLSVITGIDFPKGVIILFSAILLVKAIPFLPDIGSIFDLMAAVLLILAFFITVPQAILIIAIILLGIKGLMSLFA